MKSSHIFQRVYQLTCIFICLPSWDSTPKPRQRRSDSAGGPDQCRSRTYSNTGCCDSANESYGCTPNSGSGSSTCHTGTCGCDSCSGSCGCGSHDRSSDSCGYGTNDRGSQQHDTHNRTIAAPEYHEHTEPARFEHQYDTGDTASYPQGDQRKRKRPRTAILETTSFGLRAWTREPDHILYYIQWAEVRKPTPATKPTLHY